MNGRGNKFYEMLKPLIPEGARYHEMNCRSGYASVSIGTPERLPLNQRQAIYEKIEGFSVHEPNYNGTQWFDVRHRLLDVRFDRKRFDPERDYDDRTILNLLRANGRSRLRHIAGNWRGYRDVHSTALRELCLQHGNGRFVDLGAGDSGDCVMANRLGYEAIAFDLFPRSKEADEYPWTEYVIGDVVESIAVPDQSVDFAVCQAVIDLIEPVARPQFYANVRQVMKPKGLFSMSFYKLRHGWGYDQQREKKMICATGFRAVRSYSTGWVFQAV